MTALMESRLIPEWDIFEISSNFVNNGVDEASYSNNTISNLLDFDIITSDGCQCYKNYVDDHDTRTSLFYRAESTPDNFRINYRSIFLDFYVAVAVKDPAENIYFRKDNFSNVYCYPTSDDNYIFRAIDEEENASPPLYFGGDENSDYYNDSASFFKIRFNRSFNTRQARQYLDYLYFCGQRIEREDIIRLEINPVEDVEFFDGYSSYSFFQAMENYVNPSNYAFFRISLSFNFYYDLNFGDYYLSNYNNFFIMFDTGLTREDHTNISNIDEISAFFIKASIGAAKCSIIYQDRFYEANTTWSEYTYDATNDYYTNSIYPLFGDYFNFKHQGDITPYNADDSNYKHKFFLSENTIETDGGMLYRIGTPAYNREWKPDRDYKLINNYLGNSITSIFKPIEAISSDSFEDVVVDVDVYDLLYWDSDHSLFNRIIYVERYYKMDLLKENMSIGVYHLNGNNADHLRYDKDENKNFIYLDKDDNVNQIQIIAPTIYYSEENRKKTKAYN